MWDKGVITIADSKWSPSPLRMYFCFLILCSIMIARFSAFGFRYFPQLDDYIQYHNYLYIKTFTELAQQKGVLSSRPLAGLADYFIWGRLYDNMIVSAVILGILYVLSIIIQFNLLRRYFKIGPIFLIVACFLPVSMEGQYWVSASSRITMALFFGSLASLAFFTWLDTENPVYFLLYIPLQILPFGFYEQEALQTVTLTILLALLELPKHRSKTSVCLWSLLCIPLCLLYARVMAGNNVYSDRANFAALSSSYYSETSLPNLFRQLKLTLIDANTSILVNGFARGTKILSAHLLWFAGIILLAILFATVCWKSIPSSGKEIKKSKVEKSSHSRALQFLYGLLLFAAPLSLYFVLTNTYVTMRGISLAVPGLALMADSIISSITKIFPCQNQNKLSVISSILIILFSVSALSELCDYKTTWEYDQRTARDLLETINDLPENTRIGIIGLEGKAAAEQNYYYHGHINSCSGSDWALSGLLSAVNRKIVNKDVFPISSDSLCYRAWNAEELRPDQFEYLYYYNDRELIPLRIKVISSGFWQLYTLDTDELLGEIHENRDIEGIFYPNAYMPAL